MPFVHLLQESFNSGELSPLLASRVTSQNYASGCSRMENFIPRVQGGAFKRPGLEYIGNAYSSDARMYPFKRSTETNFMLEFGDEYLCFWIGGSSPGPIGVPSSPAWVSGASGGLWANSVSYVVGDQREKNGIVFRCTQAHFSGSTTEPSVGDSWAAYWITIPFYEVGDTVLYSGDVYYCKERHQAGSAFAPSFWFVMDGIYKIVTPYSATDVFELQFTQLNDVLFIAHPNHPPKRLSRLADDRWVLEDVPFQFAPALDINEDAVSVQLNFDGIPEFGVLWASAIEYEAGDRVHGSSTTGPSTQGNIYECREKHTSDSAKEPGKGVDQATYWNLIAAGYKVGDRVTAIGLNNPFYGEIFTCHTTYVLTVANQRAPGDGAGWENYWNKGTSRIFTAAWAANKNYVVGVRVKQGGNIYRCRVAHKSAAPKKQVDKNAGAQGNQPGISKTWAVFWQRVGSDNDLSGLKYKLNATNNLFDASDVGSKWLLEIGSRGNWVAVPTPATIGTELTSSDTPLFIQGSYSVTTSYSVDQSMIGDITLEESHDNEQWQPIKQWTFADVSDKNIDYTGDTPSVGAWYRIRVRKTDTSATLKKVRLTSQSSVHKLSFLIEEYVSPVVVKGRVLMPGDKYPPGTAIGISTAIFRPPAFSANNGYPASVAFHDSRLWWGGTKKEPSRMWASHVEDYYIYLTGSLDTDGLDLTLAAIESNSIQWMASFNRSLVVGTTGDEWTVDSGDTDEALTPTNKRARRRTRYGSGRIPPQLTGDAIIWVQRGESRLREFTYMFQKDGFDAPDLTALSEHILPFGIKQMAFQTFPENILWVADGVGLASFTYSREHNVLAWSRHVLPGISDCNSVAVMYGEDSSSDEVWILGFGGRVCRLQPNTMRFFFGPSSPTPPVATFSCFSDLSVYKTGVYNSGANKTEFSGLDHLEGYDDVCFFNGIDSYASSSNEGGVVSFDGNILAKTGWIGIPYTSELWTMDLALPLDNGSSAARPMRCSVADLHLYKSMRGIVGPIVWATGTPFDGSGEIEETQIEYKSNNDQQPYPSFTGKTGTNHVNASWMESLRVGVKSADPCPFNILGLVLKVQVEE